MYRKTWRKIFVIKKKKSYVHTNNYIICPSSITVHLRNKRATWSRYHNRTGSIAKKKDSTFYQGQPWLGLGWWCFFFIVAPTDSLPPPHHNIEIAVFSLHGWCFHIGHKLSPDSIFRKAILLSLFFLSFFFMVLNRCILGVCKGLIVELLNWVRDVS